MPPEQSLEFLFYFLSYLFCLTKFVPFLNKNTHKAASISITSKLPIIYPILSASNEKDDD